MFFNFDTKLQMMREIYPNMKEVPLPKSAYSGYVHSSTTHTKQAGDTLVIHHQLYTKLVTQFLFSKRVNPKSMCLPAQVMYCSDLASVLAPVQHLEAHQVAWVGEDGAYYVRLDYVCTANPECAMVLVALSDVWSLRHMYRAATNFQNFNKQEREELRTGKQVVNMLHWLQREAQPSLFHARSNQLMCDLPFCKFAVDDKLVPQLNEQKTKSTPSVAKSAYRVLPPTDAQGRPQLLMAVPIATLQDSEMLASATSDEVKAAHPSLLVNPNLRDLSAEAANLCPPPSRKYISRPRLNFTFTRRSPQEPDLFERQ